MPRATTFRQTRAAQIALLLATTALTSSLIVVEAHAQNLPTGGSIAAGGVAIAAPTPTQMNITQTTQSAVVNWQSFSVGQGYSVNIQQPNSTSALLNRVTGDTPSTIAGSITANGHVYLVNPNGIAITSTGIVNTGGFVASTLGISDGDFMSGKRSFAGNGASAGVTNAGTITVGRGGYAALIGGTVENSGSIVAPLGKVGLGSGEHATLDFSGDGFLQVAMPTAAGGSDALIRNSGTIRANGGSVIISAATAREAARNAVNISGVVQARTIGGRSGSITIGGGLGGAVKITGEVTATANKTIGGAITVTGQYIVLDGATIDVTGRSGGGTVNIGGGRQGQGPLQHADTLSVDATTTIRADATTTGNGGNVVLWSDQLTTFAGTITARGGFLSGNGGSAEVSGKAKLAYTGFTDLSAAKGRFGTLLLDPFNVIISNDASNIGVGFVATTNDSIINASTLQTALSAANVTIATGTDGAQAGNITVAAPLTWGAATTLELIAAGGIAINAPISITGAGGLALTATAQAGITTTGLTFGNGASVDYGATDKGGTFRLNGENYTLVYSMAQFDAIDGVNAVDGSALALHGEGLTGKYALATNLDATGTTYTQGLVGINSSEDSNTQFTGRLDGLGHTVTGLTIEAPGVNWVGLLGYVSGSDASVSNIGLVGGSVSGSYNIGSLVGWLDGGVVQNSFSSASVTSSEQIAGGLVGFNAGGTVQSSQASGTVNAPSQAGGLIGWSDELGVVTNSHATGAVAGDDEVGGLVGLNYGLVSKSYATGAVTSGSNAGGLIGANSGKVQSSHASGTVNSISTAGGLIGAGDETSSVTDSYATGVVTSVEDRAGGLMANNLGQVSNSYATGVVKAGNTAGGLIGANGSGTVINSYATGAVTTATTAGGLIGSNVGGAVTNSYATGAVTATGAEAGGLIAVNNNATVSNSYATGSVTATQFVGGLIGINTLGTVVQDSYATGSVTGTNNNIGGLIGRNQGLVQATYATGTVLGKTRTGGLVGYNFGGTVQNSYATGNVTGSSNTGGLVGQNSANNTIPSSPIRSSISTSYATGAVFGVNFINGAGAVVISDATGGLVGANVNSSVQSSYATGAVSGQIYAGGLVGQNSISGSVQTSYATGAVSSTAASTGGLVGFNEVNSTVSTSYWNTQTSGRTFGIGLDNNSQSGNVTGLTTAQLQGALPAGFNTAIWSTGAGLYAYLNWQFAPGTTPQSISGIAYQADGTVLAGATVAGTLDGKAFAGTTGTGANGYYYFLLPQGSTAQGRGVFVDIAGNAVKSNAYVRGASGSVQNLDLRDSLLTIRTDATALSGAASGLANAVGLTPTSDLVFTTPGGVLTPNARTSVSLTAAGAFNVDQNLVVPNAVTIKAAGNLTVASTGSVSSSSSNATLVAGSIFINNRGADAVSAANGRWLVYSADPRNDMRGGLAYDFKQYGATYGVTTVAQATGNGVLYSVVPTATVAITGTVSKTYDGNTGATPGPSTHVTGIDGDVVAVSYANATYDNANVGIGKAVTVDGLSITSAGNGGATVYGYLLGSTTAIANIGTITARAITVTADAQSRVYGDANPALTYTVGGLGLVAGESLSGGLTTSATTTTGVGSYGITQGDLATSGNYAVTYTGANLSVTARAITVTADAQSRVYGDANPTLTYAVGGRGLVNGDALSGGLTTSATTATGVGSYGIARGDLAASSNYTLAYTGANLAVTARAITVTADAQSRVYGDANPALTYAVSGRGLVNGDALSGGLTTGATTTTGVGNNYAITQGDLAASSNYTLAYTSANLSVTARAITVTADAQSRVYGDANPALTYAVGGRGFVNGDGLSGGLTTSATTTTGVGSYGITQGDLAASGNYAVTYTGANLSVTTRAITVTADAQSRVYGDANPALTYAVGGRGLVNGDGLSGGLTTSATTATGVGSYGIARGDLAASGNYAVTYTGANLSVTARAITVTADAQSRAYGDANPALTYTVGTRGLVNGDTLAGSLATTATPFSAIGPYAITQGTVVSAANPNYAITYTGADLTVVAAPPAPAPTPAPTNAEPPTSPFIVAGPNAPASNASSMSLQSDTSGTSSITPLTGTPNRVATSQPTQTTQPQQTAANQNADDEIATGSVGPQAIKSADGFVYRPLSQYDAAQYSGNKLPGYEGEAGDATIVAMLLRGTQRSLDAPKIDQLFEPGKGLQWQGVNWVNPVADKMGFSDGAGRMGAPGEKFPILAGATDLAGLLGKGAVILSASAKEPNAASFSLLGIAMTEQGIVANDPGTGRQVLLSYNPETKTLGSIVSVLDAKTGTWTKLADVKPVEGGLSQAQLDQFAKLSVDRFAAVSVPAAGPR